MSETQKNTSPPLEALRSQDPQKPLHEEVFSEWFKKENPRAVSYARKFVDNNAQAEDLAQAGWAKVIDKVTDPNAKFAEGTNIEAYLTTTIRNLATDNARKEDRRKTELVWDIEERGQRSSPSAEDQVVSNASVKQVLASIPDDFREIFYRREMLDETYDEISLRSGKALGTVQSGLHRGRKAAKKAYQLFNEDHQTASDTRKKITEI